MTELKTLKDLKKNFPYDKATGSITRGFMIEEFEKRIKQEAIKWVKFMEKLDTAEDMIYEKDWKKIFKEFHNITEEDLK